MADLIDTLTKEGQNFSFFQAAMLLEEYFAKKHNDSAPFRSGRVRFFPDPSIVFPQSDISKVASDGEQVRVMLSFMGMVGASSPLPNYFSDYIARYPENAQALYDFCTIFNNRVHALFYRAFCKYRFSLAVLLGGFLSNVSHLAGNPGGGPQGAQRMLAYAGVLSSRRRSARALETVISNYFDGVPVGVKEWLPRWTPVANPTKLGSAAALGVSTTIGTEIFDMAGKFRVSVGPLKRDMFETFLDRSPKIKAMRKLVQSFMTDPLEFDIEVRLSAQDLIAVVLGQENARLGQTSSLGSSAAATGDAYAVVLAGNN
jgi:type VI secretion system protein ImpH